MKYIFFAEDDKSAIKIVEDQILEFDIKKTTIDSYIFGKNQYLKKVDSKQLEFLKKLSLQDEKRLFNLINYPIK